MKHIQGFIEDVEGQADWRARKADEYPDDVRNANASKGLTDLAKFIAVLPDDAPILIRLDAALVRLYSDPDIMFTMEPSVTDILGQFRFGRTMLKSEGFEEFISGLIEVIERHVSSEDGSESRLRSKLRRMGHRMSRSRKPVSIDNMGDFMVIDVDANAIVLGERYDATLDEIAQWAA
jgi:hypothetical protein